MKMDDTENDWGCEITKTGVIENGEADCIIHAFYVKPKAALIYRT